jgi:hypothetical protein
MKTAFAVNGFTDLRPVLALSPVVTLCRRRRSRRVAVGRTGSKSSALRGEGRGKQWFVRGATMLKIKETTCSRAPIKLLRLLFNVNMISC